MMQQTHQMDQYQMPMAPPPQQMPDQQQQYMWQQQDVNQRNFAGPPPMPMYNSPMMDPQMHYVSILHEPILFRL